MTDEQDFLSEAEATRLWQRAAQLQAEEARRAEARAAAEAEGELLGPGDRSSDRPSEGYALTHVRTAALEAGIGAEFVEAALAEVQSDRVIRRDAGAGRHRLSRWILGNPDDSVTVRRIVHAAPPDILDAMEALFPNEPYTLMLRERLGDPSKGGTLVFDIQGVGFSTASQPGFRGDVSYADLRQVYATLTPLPGEGARTEMTLRAPVAWAYGINAGISGALSLLGGGLALGVTGAVGSGLGLLGPVGLGLLIAVAGGGGTAAGLAGFRALYRFGLGRGARGLNGLLATLAAKAEGGWSFASPDA